MPVVGEAGNRITWNRFFFVACGDSTDESGIPIFPTGAHVLEQEAISHRRGGVKVFAGSADH
jgi:hypothetical protein